MTLMERCPKDCGWVDLPDTTMAFGFSHMFPDGETVSRRCRRCEGTGYVLMEGTRNDLLQANRIMGFAYQENVNRQIEKVRTDTAERLAEMTSWMQAALGPLVTVGLPGDEAIEIANGGGADGAP